MFLTVFCIIIVFGIALVIFCHCLEHQGNLARRASHADQSLAHSKARSAFLDEVLPALTRARKILHSELVLLTGERAEFEHGLAVARSYKDGAKQGPIDQRAFEREQYRHALEMLRLQNNLVAETDRATLRPLRLEAQRTRLRVEADERVVESIFTQQAIEEARGRKRGSTAKLDEAATLSAALGVLIEEYKADGKDTAGLELALNALLAADERGER
jgi:hypothetical protein